jgi:hypothetical protein
MQQRIIPPSPIETIVDDHGVIHSLGDFLMLDIIDWDRCHPYEDVQRVMRSTASLERLLPSDGEALTHDIVAPIE